MTEVPCNPASFKDEEDEKIYCQHIWSDPKEYKSSLSLFVYQQCNKCNLIRKIISKK